MRFRAVAAVLLVWAGSIGTASAATYSAPVVGLGSGFSTTNEISGYASPDTTQCTAGHELIGQETHVWARCALEFDVSTIPDGAVVDSATLSLHTSAVTACAGGCQLAIYGYSGNAFFAIADLTAGDFLGTMGSGQGTTTTLDVSAFVQSILDSGAGVPIAGIRIGRYAANPPNDRTVIAHPASANPPTLVVKYSLTGRDGTQLVPPADAVGTTTFFVSSDVTSDERQALPLATEDLAGRLVTQISEGW